MAVEVAGEPVQRARGATESVQPLSYESIWANGPVTSSGKHSRVGLDSVDKDE